jgi:hypothetical protein
MELTESFILAVLGLVGGGGSACLVYFLKSRCKTIKCCCIECQRDVIPNVVASIHHAPTTTSNSVV